MPPTGSTRPLSVISPVIATSSRTGWFRSRRQDRRGHRDAGRRAVLRDRAGRHVDVQVVLVEELRRRRRAPRASARMWLTAARADSCITLPSWPVRMMLLVAARQQARFDEQHVAAGFGPGQAGGHARARRAERDLLLEPRRTEVVVDLVRASTTVVAAAARRAGASRPARRPCARSCRAAARGCGRRLRACTRRSPRAAPRRRARAPSGVRPCSLSCRGIR